MLQLYCELIFVEKFSIGWEPAANVANVIVEYSCNQSGFDLPILWFNLYLWWRHDNRISDTKG